MSKEQSDSDSSKLEARVVVLEELFIRLAQAGATESILGHGFESVSDRLKTVSDRLEDIAYQVAPLRSLGPQPPDWRPEQKTMMNNLYNALVPPKPGDEKRVPQAGDVYVAIYQRSES